MMHFWPSFMSSVLCILAIAVLLSGSNVDAKNDEKTLLRARSSDHDEEYKERDLQQVNVGCSWVRHGSVWNCENSRGTYDCFQRPFAGTCMAGGLIGGGAWKHRSRPTIPCNCVCPGVNPNPPGNPLAVDATTEDQPEPDAGGGVASSPSWSMP